MRICNVWLTLLLCRMAGNGAVMHEWCMAGGGFLACASASEEDYDFAGWVERLGVSVLHLNILDCSGVARV